MADSKKKRLMDLASSVSFAIDKGTYKVPNEIETKRNETKSTKTKRSETKSTKKEKNKRQNEIKK